MPPKGATGLLRAILFWTMVLLCLGIGGYALFAYTTRPIGEMVHPDIRRNFQEHRAGIVTHAIGASIALMLGPWQFIGKLRARVPRLHRWMGRIYLLGILVGGLAGLYMSWFAFGGWVSTGGFGTLALLWLWTGVQAYRTARARQFAAHRAWMIRNFALALSAVTLRIGLPIGFGMGWPFEVFYPALAWVSWVPNLLVAEWMVRPKAKQKAVPKPAPSPAQRPTHAPAPTSTPPSAS